MSLPRASRPADEILAELDALKQHDVRWKEGRAFTLAYYAGPDVADLGDEAYRRFSSDTRSTPTPSRACAGSSPMWWRWQPSCSAADRRRPAS
ncbi:MAG TPA: hypothetical protein VNO51_00895 [Ilumatobacteraceae bacterium]|nr:hypothetical protein [Ilumatobacteraceae bacterium]